MTQALDTALEQLHDATEPKHTPGPWKSSHRGDGMIAVYAERDTKKPICVFHDEGGEFPKYFNEKKAEANARLIAAAPETAAERDRLKEINAELLAALEKLAIGENAGLHETEYDGRTYTLCEHCSYQDDVRPKHDKSCPILIARAAIAKARGQA